MIERLLRRPRFTSYRGRAQWCANGDGWHIHFDPPLDVPGHSHASIDLSPPPPEGPEEFPVEIEFERLPYEFPWQKAKAVGMMLMGLYIFIVGLKLLFWSSGF